MLALAFLVIKRLIQWRFKCDWWLLLCSWWWAVTDSWLTVILNLKHTGEAEDSSCSQWSDRSWRVGGTRRARWPRAPAHWEVSVRETQHDLRRTALSSRSSSLSQSSCRLLDASLSPNDKFSSLKERTTLLAHYHSSRFNSTKTFCLSLNSVWV